VLLPPCSRSSNLSFDHGKKRKRRKIAKKKKGKKGRHELAKAGRSYPSHPTICVFSLLAARSITNPQEGKEDFLGGKEKKEEKKKERRKDHRSTTPATLVDLKSLDFVLVYQIKTAVRFKKEKKKREKGERTPETIFHALSHAALGTGGGGGGQGEEKRKRIAQPISRRIFCDVFPRHSILSLNEKYRPGK